MKDFFKIKSRNKYSRKLLHLGMSSKKMTIVYACILRGIQFERNSRDALCLIGSEVQGLWSSLLKLRMGTALVYNHLGPVAPFEKGCARRNEGGRVLRPGTRQGSVTLRGDIRGRYSYTSISISLLFDFVLLKSETSFQFNISKSYSAMLDTPFRISC